MGKHISRRLRAEHLLPFGAGSPRDIKWLLDALNDHGYENGHTVREMVRNMNIVSGITEQRPVPRNAGPYFPGWQKELRKYGFDESFANRMAKIRDTFDGSRFEVQILFPEEGRWRFEWRIPWRFDRSTQNWSELYPFLDIIVIRHLAEDGRLRLIRECETCGRWFLAHRPSPKYRFHSNACRDKYWRKTPEGKAKRRDFMRGYRERLKKREEAKLKAATFHRTEMSRGRKNSGK